MHYFRFPQIKTPTKQYFNHKQKNNYYNKTAVYVQPLMLFITTQTRITKALIKYISLDRKFNLRA